MSKKLTPIKAIRAKCLDCSGKDQRVGGLDDYAAICVPCGGVMLRLDEDVFQPYFEEISSQIWAETKTKATV